ncbi:MAG: hypothetical protein KAI02_04215 [Gammaproteobacteria bacterium]|nr:hypothetical protein [Gammaproteobacteria bacterium]
MGDILKQFWVYCLLIIILMGCSTTPPLEKCLSYSSISQTCSSSVCVSRSSDGGCNGFTRTFHPCNKKVCNQFECLYGGAYPSCHQKP